MNKDLPQQLDRESLSQLSKEEGVHIIIEQAIAIKQLQAASKKLQHQNQHQMLVTKSAMFSLIYLRIINFIHKRNPLSNKAARIN